MTPTKPCEKKPLSFRQRFRIALNCVCYEFGAWGYLLTFLLNCDIMTVIT